MSEAMKLEKDWQHLVSSLEWFAEQSSFSSNKVILGLSRGFDSTMVAAVAAQALGGDNVIGVAMPSPFSEDQDLEESRELAEHLGIQFMSVPIHDQYSIALSTLEGAQPGVTKKWGTMQENLQSRLRATMLMALSNAGLGMVLNASNLSERLLGYYTNYGDNIGSIGVLGNYFKTELWDIAHAHNEVSAMAIIPEHIISVPPTAELAPGQNDESVFGSYEKVDEVLSHIVKIMRDSQWDAEISKNVEAVSLMVPKVDQAYIESIVRRVMNNNFKLKPLLTVPSLLGRKIGE